MAEPLVIGLLSSKRAEIAGVIADLERQVAEQRAALLHLDATIRLFDPGARPETIRPKSANAFLPFTSLQNIVLRYVPSGLSGGARVGGGAAGGSLGKWGGMENMPAVMSNSI